jgi:hypothetical protein
MLMLPGPCGLYARGGSHARLSSFRLALLSLTVLVGAHLVFLGVLCCLSLRSCIFLCFCHTVVFC